MSGSGRVWSGCRCGDSSARTGSSTVRRTLWRVPSVIWERRCGPNKAIQEAPQHNDQGRHALRTVVPWQETVVKLNDRDTMSTGTSALLSGTSSQTREGFADCYVPPGRIRKLNLNSGCHTTYEIWQLSSPRHRSASAGGRSPGAPQRWASFRPGLSQPSIWLPARAARVLHCRQIKQVELRDSSEAG